MDHGMGIVIGETAVIGNAGATVLGNITLGKGSKIGAGALVLDDVPANTTAVGMPVRIIYHEK